MRKIFPLLLVPLMAFAAEPPMEKIDKEKIQVVPVIPSPEPENATLRVVFPRGGEVEKNPMTVQVRLEGYPLGVVSGLEREKEIARSNLGQSMHVIIDDKPYFPRIGARVDPYDDDGNYFHATYRFTLPYPLSEGMHTLRIFPARSYGESLKEGQVFASRCFAIRSTAGEKCYDLSAPFLTYNEPSTFIAHTVKKPVLLDFYLSNCVISQDGYKVKLTLDSTFERTLTIWTPYYIYGLDAGDHTIRLQLIDNMGNLVPGAFNDVERHFTVSSS